jgi:hypothetical protein
MTSKTKGGKLLIESRLVSFEEAAKMIGGLSPSTIRQRKARTENLTHVHGFGRRIFLIRSEVEKLVDEKINQSLSYDRQRKRLMGM